MLQQTQVATVIPYWERWMTHFPTLDSLAQADEQTVLSHWQGLGYYRRCKLLKRGVEYVLENGLPTSATQWQKVPGIGRYTAGAIASIAQGLSAPLVDGNVARVYSRWYGDKAEYDQLLKNAWLWAEKKVHPSRPGDWNQALMELGATICTPVNPKCSQCPLSAGCVANQNNLVHVLPHPKARSKIKELNQVFVIAIYNDSIILEQKKKGDWWEDMWCLPTFETHEAAETAFPNSWLEQVGSFKYSVTHHRVDTNIVVIRLDRKPDNHQFVSFSKLADLPIPSPYRKALKHL
jgi:A/G-specific adenine glycosylase